VSVLDPLPELLVEPIVRAALEEDFGRLGDLTSAATIPADARAQVLIRARQDGRVAGLQPARAALRLVDPDLKIAVVTCDGEDIEAGGTICAIQGPTRSILSAERVALNFLGHMSGIATATRAFVRAVSHTKARITCTRKTTPLLRALEKYAVRAGGGVNHRFGLDDAILIKDNHIAAAGGIGEALNAARAYAGHMVRIEIEVDTLAQFEEALALRADAVLLDNFTPADLRTAVERRDASGHGMVLEASGGVSLDTIAAIAETGVDVISVGRLTHSSPSLDVGLDFDKAL